MFSGLSVVATRGGGSLIGPKYGDVSLFRGTSLLKVVEIWVSVSETRTELWVTFQEAYRIMGSVLEKWHTITRQKISAR